MCGNGCVISGLDIGYCVIKQLIKLNKDFFNAMSHSICNKMCLDIELWFSLSLPKEDVYAVSWVCLSDRPLTFINFHTYFDKQRLCKTSLKHPT